MKSLKIKHMRSIRATFMHYTTKWIFMPMIIAAVLQSIILFANAYISAVDSSEDSIDRANQYMTDFAENLIGNANTIVFNSNVQELLNTDCTLDNIINGNVSPASPTFRTWQNASNLIVSNLSLYNDLVKNAYLFNWKGDLVLSMYRSKINNLQTNIYHPKTPSSVLRPLWICPRDAGQSDILYLIRPIPSLGEYSADSGLGYFALELDRREFYERLSQFAFSRTTHLTVLDHEGFVILSPNPALLGSDCRNQIIEQNSNHPLKPSFFKKDIVVLRKNEITGMHIMDSLDFFHYFNPYIQNLGWSIMISFLLLALASFASLRLSRLISQPVLSLADKLRRVKGSNPLPGSRPDIHPVSEISELEQSFTEMVTRLDTLVKANTAAGIREEQLKSAAFKAELSALQHQINPHFLYNTLDSINWMAAMGATDEVCEMITALSDYFRYSIQGNTPYATIGEEVQNVKNYIFMQHRRFSRLKVFFDVEDSVLDGLTVRLMLQPLVENSILHGVNAGGNVWVGIRRCGRQVLYSIKDNGIGMDDKSLKQLLHEDGTRSIGFYNVRQRLMLMFKDQVEIDIKSKPGEGTEIIIKTPWEQIPPRRTASSHSTAPATKGSESIHVS